MENHQKSGNGLTCLAIILTLAVLVSAGCLDSAQKHLDQTIPANEKQAGNPAPGTVLATKATYAATAPQKTPPPVSAPVSSTGVITLDPISDKDTGDSFTLTGTTSLPAGTNIFWQIMPDTGTPPTGLDPDSMMSVGGNYQVIKGNGTRNRISVGVELGRLVPGKYVAIVGKMKGDQTTGLVFEIDNNYGYTSFTLK
jgi:hypothetical protein